MLFVIIPQIKQASSLATAVFAILCLERRAMRYSHVTDTMQKQAAVKIDHQIGKTDAPMPQEEKKQHTDQSGYQPYQPKRRKPGTGCVYQINEHLWEGKYSPKGADGKRIRRNVYAPTKEECEEKLEVMIEEVKKEIATEKKNNNRGTLL